MTVKMTVVTVPYCQIQFFFLKFETIDEFSSLENGIFDESFGVNSNISRGQDHD